MQIRLSRKVDVRAARTVDECLRLCLSKRISAVQSVPRAMSTCIACAVTAYMLSSFTVSTASILRQSVDVTNHRVAVSCKALNFGRSAMGIHQSANLNHGKCLRVWLSDRYTMLEIPREHDA
jgi:hypothetical protein